MSGPEATLVGHCRQMVRDFGGDLELVSQRRAKGSGTTVGFPDGVLYRRGCVYLIEFKSEDGKLTRGQELAIMCRAAEGVATYVVASEQQFADLLGGKLRAAD